MLQKITKLPCLLVMLYSQNIVVNSCVIGKPHPSFDFTNGI